MAAANTAPPLVIVGCSALLAAGLGYMAYKSTSSSGTSSSSRALTITDIDDDDDTSDMITAEECTRLFDRLFREMQAIFAQLMNQVQAIQMAGQSIPESQLRVMLKGEMERALVAKQKMLLDEFDMDEECWEEATWEFLADDEKDHKELATAVNRFQKFWENVSNDEHAGWRPGQAKKASVTLEALSPERLTEVAKIYFDSLTNQMKELVEEYKAEGKDLKNPAVQHQLNLDFSDKAQMAGESALQKEGVSMDQFEFSIKAHAENPSVGRQLQMMQMQQQMELQSIGSGAR